MEVICVQILYRNLNSRKQLNNRKGGSMKKKNSHNKKLLALEIVSPIASIVLSIISATFNFWSVDIRVGIISCGIIIPIIILQFSTDNHFEEQEKHITNEFSNLNNQVAEFSEILNPLSPMFEKIVFTKNDKLKNFALRRIFEVREVIDHAINQGNSGNLNPTEYYDELNSLALLLEEDYKKHKDNYCGEIWAMTSFAPDEWVAENDTYEALWSDRLLKLSKKIKVRRICLISNGLKNSMKSFDDEKNLSNELKGFIELYRSYKNFDNVEHYLVNDSADIELKNIKGFFGIKLHDGDLYLIYGETVGEKGALTAQLLFKSEEINSIYSKFNSFTKDRLKVDNVLTSPNNHFGNFYVYLKSL